MDYAKGISIGEEMVRRVIAILGILSLALTIMPGVPDAASELLDCCNGIMCPMYAVQTHAPDCGMDRNGSGAALKPCPVQAAAHFTAATVFLLRAPAVLHHNVASEPAIAFLPNFSPDAERRVDSPPPRLPLRA
jgi:hypothetical protein